MANKEAQARLKINNLLIDAGWRLLDGPREKANVVLENNVKIAQTAVEAFGDDFEQTKNGFIDFLLLDEKGFPLVVLEAKSEDKDPLAGKEQARKYAISQNCRFIILSNGNLHYFWDLQQGNPHTITKFPTQKSFQAYTAFQPNPQKIVDESVFQDYIVLTQKPNYAAEPEWNNTATKAAFIEKHKLKFLRSYQLRAVYSIQEAVGKGRNRFLFEMATGTGKTLIASAIIKLFLRTGNARRVLFLVDRLELEDQANKAFVRDLKNDFTSVIYKENRDDWRKAEIVVSTVQSLLFNNKYIRHFSPTDFDLVISDEAHRSIGGNARALFNYFIGYKLGLTATPKDYLKKVNRADDPRDYERRLMLDTYKTFGCESGYPTYRYSLLDGVKDGFLISPRVVDARTDITTQLLTDEGYSVVLKDEGGNSEEVDFFKRDFEKKFYSEETNFTICNTFLQNALRDPISKEIGKSIVFAVSQRHAAKLTQILNHLADLMFPGKYNSDFAVQVTSQVADAQQFTINFANNNLLGSSNFLPEYKTSKARVCVTVGMMTTGYDCPDILNICLMRPIFSPTDFIQIKGRGTRKFRFTELLLNEDMRAFVEMPEKVTFKLFDFFANCEYFEEKFKYDEVLKLPRFNGPRKTGDPLPPVPPQYENTSVDEISLIKEHDVGFEGMKIDRMFFQSFEDKVKEDPYIRTQVESGHWDVIVNYLNLNVLNKPEEFYTLEKLRKAAGVDRKITIREILEKIYGLIPYFKSKDQLLDEEFEKFILDCKPDDPSHIVAMRYFFKAYAGDAKVREIIDTGAYTELYHNPSFTMADYRAIPQKWRELIPGYVKDYVIYYE